MVKKCAYIFCKLRKNSFPRIWLKMLKSLLFYSTENVCAFFDHHGTHELDSIGSKYCSTVQIQSMLSWCSMCNCHLRTFCNRELVTKIVTYKSQIQPFFVQPITVKWRTRCHGDMNQFILPLHYVISDQGSMLVHEK